MRKFLIPALLLSTVVAVAPAAANHGGYHRDRASVGWNRGGPSRQAINELLRDLNRAENRIERSVQRRIISQREAFSLRREANQIERRLQLRQPQRHQRPRVRRAAGPGQPARAAPAHRAPRPRRPPRLKAKRAGAAN